MPKLNSWNVSYAAIVFFEGALKAHSKVKSFRRSKDILFKIETENGQHLEVLLVNEYTLGLAAIHRAQQEFPSFEYIVTSANWNGYTREAKEYGKESGLGVFNLGEFLGALHWTHPKKYYKKDSRGKPTYAYKSA